MAPKTDRLPKTPEEVAAQLGRIARLKDPDYIQTAEEATREGVPLPSLTAIAVDARRASRPIRHS
jgi:hypothetical protein